MKKIILINISKSDFDFPGYKIYKKNFNIYFNDDKKKIEKKRVVGILAGLENYSQKKIEAYPNLKVISRFGTGIDNIDLFFAKKKKILVQRTKLDPVLPTAEHTVTLILMILKNIYTNISNLRKKKWIQLQGYNLKSKTVGIIGLGLIGKTVADILFGFGCKIIYYDIKNIKIKRYLKVSLKKLISTSNIICIHANYSKNQENLINKKTLRRFKKNAILVNTARGGFVNEEDLYLHLKKNSKFFAGVDCFKSEPYYGKLLKLNNFFATPHISSNTKESRKMMSKNSFMNIIKNL